jgi:hypothetical protein
MVVKRSPTIKNTIFDKDKRQYQSYSPNKSLYPADSFINAKGVTQPKGTCTE